MRNKILQGDAWQLAGGLPDNSINCIVTSPPYYGLRDYGEPGQFGLEETPEAYVGRLVDLFGRLRGKLRDDGVVWLNLGDSYAGSNKGRNGDGTREESGFQGNNQGSIRGVLKISSKMDIDISPKNLLGMPWRVALALQADGWILRADIIWAKLNPMPESVTDRPTKAHEYIFLLAKRGRYWYDAEAVKRKAINGERFHGAYGAIGGDGVLKNDKKRNGRFDENNTTSVRNLRTVWTIATTPYKDAHFATFPPDLIRPCIRAGCPPLVCGECGEPWVRVVEREPIITAKPNDNLKLQSPAVFARGGNQAKYGQVGNVQTKTLGWQPTCTCFGHFETETLPIDPAQLPTDLDILDAMQDDTFAWMTPDEIRADLTPKPKTITRFILDGQYTSLAELPTRPGVVLDPFLGSGTTAQVAIEENRDWLGFELSADYVKLANRRIAKAYATSGVTPERLEQVSDSVNEVQLTMF